MKLQRFVRDIPKFERSRKIEEQYQTETERDSIETLYGIDGKEMKPQSPIDSYTPVLYRVVRDPAAMDVRESMQRI